MQYDQPMMCNTSCQIAALGYLYDSILHVAVQW